MSASAEFVVGAHDLRQISSEVGAHLDRDAALLRHIAPACAGEIHRLLRQGAQVHRLEHRLRVARPIKFAHARNGSCDIIDGTLNDFELRPPSSAEPGSLSKSESV